MRRGHRKGPALLAAPVWEGYYYPVVPLSFLETTHLEVISLTVEVHQADTTFTAFTEGKRLQFCSSAK